VHATFFRVDFEAISGEKGMKRVHNLYEPSAHSFFSTTYASVRVDLQKCFGFDESVIHRFDLDFVLQSQCIDDVQRSGGAKEGDVVENGLWQGHE